ncbi:hypothetical protein SADUNF_Sadunf10G0150800 [Salix dunnii]|uniref:Uncharacterized protein n=1 Tax=Salix dunnii TaxID=1413687 RepID=A0A835JRI7_9ROSI|nr:hypothetical protein SADUNF_Sadunf10G0150800 [Salix dunnii]
MSTKDFSRDLFQITGRENNQSPLLLQNTSTKDGKSIAPFGIVFAIDDPLTDGPDQTSEII